MKKIVKNCKICNVKIDEFNSLKGTFLSRHGYYKRCIKCIKIYNKRRTQNIDKSLEKKRLKRYRKKNWPLFLLNSARRNRKSRKNNNVTITKNWILEQYNIQNKRCYWSGVRFYITTDDHPLKPSLDRLVVGGKYSKDNTILSLKSINFGRNENSIEDLKKFLKRVVLDN